MKCWGRPAGVQAAMTTLSVRLATSVPFAVSGTALTVPPHRGMTGARASPVGK